ncbi:hypothetical protein OC842_004766 [Tilletia horrida]|uniref:Beta-mannosidase A n=1 Tax=Tilletia horrida TaxID=155126 RepID=A0AAN6JJR8_9BASI|nr:hypothetical protein OC842_004766 [Tilletia horrida]
MVACIHPLNKDDDPSLQWRLSNANGSIDIVSATAGRSVHQDLLHAGLIPDPDVGLNEGTTRWVAEEEHWTYSTALNLMPSAAADDEDARFLLHFQSIDTRATISFEGKGPSAQVRTSFETNNAHRRWTFDVSEHMRSQPSTLSIRLHSPIAYAALESQNEPRYPTQIDVPDAPASQQYEFPYRNFIRKPSSDFGWDWGPAYADSGFGRVSLIRFGRGCDVRSASSTKENRKIVSRTAKSASLFLIDTAIDIQSRGDHWVVLATLDLFSARKSSISNATIKTSVEDTGIYCSSVPPSEIHPGMNDDGALSVQCLVPKSAVKLWWPRGVRLPDNRPANPQLYTFAFRLVTPDGETLHWHLRTGFRTITLDQHVYTAQEVASGIAPGSAFNFRINGYPLPLPILGSNLIPFSTLPQSEDEEARKIDYTMKALLASGQNMVRVWGGGRYGSDQLYQQADELGILIWSEFAYACSLYPTYPSFINNVRIEAKEQVRRISRFASHALWAGNNEGELNMLPVARTYANGSIYRHQYELLFDGLLRDVVRAHHPSSAYIPSSTTTGGRIVSGTFVPRYRDFAEGEIHGDGEHYNYNVNQALDTSTYPRSRFVNEFGMHSMADIRSFDSIATGSDDYAFNSTIARSRSKHSPPGNLSYPWPASDGQAQMTAGVEAYFPVPRRRPSGWSRMWNPFTSRAPGSPQSADRSLLAQWAYATQCFQALFVGNQIGFYRLRASAPERNTGSLYWQLNSVWKAATDWASLEVDGRWKVLHYIVARMHAETIAYVHWNQTSQTADVHAISRSWLKSSGDATLTWYDWTGNIHTRRNVSFALGPASSTLLASFDVSRPKLRAGGGQWLHVQLRSRVGMERVGSGDMVRNEHFFTPISLGEAHLRRTKLVLRSLPRQTTPSPHHQHLNLEIERWSLSLQRPFALHHKEITTSAGATTSQTTPKPRQRTLDFEIANLGPGVAPWVVLIHSARLRGWFVAADTDGDIPSNAIWLRPGERRALRFLCYAGGSNDKENGLCPDGVSVEKDVSARSMWDSIEVPR